MGHNKYIYKTYECQRCGRKQEPNWSYYRGLRCSKCGGFLSAPNVEAEILPLDSETAAARRKPINKKFRRPGY
jgi:hypothetical protein